MGRHKKQAKSLILTAQVRREKTFNPRNIKGESKTIGNLQVFQPIDYLSGTERDDLRKASRTAIGSKLIRTYSSFVAGNGYSLEFDNSVNTEEIESIKTALDDMDLDTLAFDTIKQAVQEGRSVSMITDNQIRNIPAEHTMRPILDNETGELIGCNIVGIEDSFLESENMFYFELGNNNSLFGDRYGESRVHPITEQLFTLDRILGDDFGQVATKTWFRSPMFAIPVPPQEFGNEKGVLNEFLNTIGDPEAGITAVTKSSDKEEEKPEILSESSVDGQNITGLDSIVERLMKTTSASLGIPAWIMNIIETGSLGSSIHLPQIDVFLNTEITPVKRQLEHAIESQILDRIFGEGKVKIRFNRPNLISLLTAEQYQTFLNMIDRGHLSEEKFREMVGIEEPEKFTISGGNDTTPTVNTWNKMAV